MTMNPVVQYGRPDQVAQLSDRGPWRTPQLPAGFLPRGTPNRRRGV